ncbi:hypothetical protein JHK86_011999 [Glycine max]|nr:hypothetical protein JHK86_011999 [Glycine max]
MKCVASDSKPARSIRTLHCSLSFILSLTGPGPITAAIPEARVANACKSAPIGSPGQCQSRGNEDHVAIIHDCCSKIEAELSNICNGILKLLDTRLVPFAASSDSKVFYLKMKGDYHRYLAKFIYCDTLLARAIGNLMRFGGFWDIANTELPPTHPIRLGLALSFSVFYYEILNSPDRA